MRASVYARLGRVSNLPTVWSNALAAAALVGDAPRVWLLVGLGAGFSALYVAGMFLNDAFDVDFDRVHRPERPIPAGEIARADVFRAGFALLAGGFALVAAVALGAGNALATAPAAAALAAAIVVYDMRHKGNPLALLLMGVCRGLVYVTAGLAVAGGFSATVAPALATTAYLFGLTAVAKREISGRLDALWPLAPLAAPLAYAALQRGGGVAEFAFAVVLALWTSYAVAQLLGPRPRIERGVGLLIAGVSLVDALYISSRRMPLMAGLAFACFVVTLQAQRQVRGT